MNVKLGVGGPEVARGHLRTSELSHAWAWREPPSSRLHNEIASLSHHPSQNASKPDWTCEHACKNGLYPSV